MKTINHIYVNGEFIKPKGTETLDLINPATKEMIGQVTLGNALDTQEAIATAKAAFKTYSKTTIIERSELLQRMYDVMVSKKEALVKAMIEEYGAPVSVANMLMDMALSTWIHTKEELQNFEFTKFMGRAKVELTPIGVVGVITPWNADYIHLSNKLAPAIAMGCTVVVKPSELSAIQTQLFAECIHEAGIPAGVINIVNGTGEVVGAELTSHRDIAMLAFIGSTKTGKTISRGAVDTLKRVALELGGKSPNIILDDADFTKAIPLAAMASFINSGQACIAGTRLIVPEHRLEEVKTLIKSAVEGIKVGDVWDESSFIGPMVNQRQYDTVQRYINLGIEEGAEVVIGGEGQPEGLEQGYFVKPTVFANVTKDMTIAKEEIFGPVLSILTYRTEEEAIEIANDTIYGLSAYISTSNLEKANRIASQMESGSVLINGLHSEPKAPLGGSKQSGIGRDFGSYGLEEFVETKTILGYDVAEINLGV